MTFFFLPSNNYIRFNLIFAFYLSGSFYASLSLLGLLPLDYFYYNFFITLNAYIPFLLVTILEMTTRFTDLSKSSGTWNLPPSRLDKDHHTLLLLLPPPDLHAFISCMNLFYMLTLKQNSYYNIQCLFRSSPIILCVSCFPFLLYLALTRDSFPLA